MSEKELQFNFSKQEDQERFDSLPKEKREKISDEAQEEAEELKEKNQEGEPDCSEAEKLVKEKKKEKEITLTPKEQQIKEDVMKGLNKISRTGDHKFPHFPNLRLYEFDDLDLPEAIIKDNEIQELARKKILQGIESNYFFSNDWHAINHASKIFFDSTDKLIDNDPSIRGAVKKRLVYEIRKEYETKVSLPLHNKLIQDSAKQAIIEILSQDLHHIQYRDTKIIRINKIKNNCVLTSGDFKEAVINWIVKTINDGNFQDDFKELVTEFNITDKDTEELIVDQITKKKWKNVVLLSLNLPYAEDIYKNFINEQKQIAQDTKKPYSERQKAFDSLAGLAENGETSISLELADIIQKRGKQKEASESKRGLDQGQESAFYTLMRLNNPESNDALLNLLDNENVNTTIKYAVLKKLTRNDRNFLNKEIKEALNKWLYSKKHQELDWQDLQFVKSVLNNIPSTELRNKSCKHIGFGIKYLTEYLDIGIMEIWRKKYNTIPQNIFLQLLEFVDGDEELMGKFQNLYTAIRKENTVKENLLYGIVNSMETNPEILNLLASKLKEIDFATKQNARDLNQLFRKVIFINNITSYSGYDEEYEDQSEQGRELDTEIKQIFSQKTDSLKDLNTLLQEVATKKIQEILPHKNITAEKIEKIQENWGGMEPIFTYLSRFPELKKYIAEIIAHVDGDENWKNWRYNLDNNTVKKQIGHLSEQQLEIWQGDYFSEIGDIMIAGESGAEKPKQVQGILQDAVVNHKHIYDPERGQNKNEFIQKTLEKVYGEIDENPNNQEEIIQKEIGDILADTKQIDVVIQSSNIPRIEQSLQKVFSQGKEIDLSKKTKDTVDFLSGFLPKELNKKLKENYDSAEQQGKKVLANNIITPEIKQVLEQKIQEIQAQLIETENSDIWDKHALDKTKLKNLGQFYQKRQELKAAVDLLRLNSLSNKLIATNRVIEKEGKKGGETLLSVVGNLQKYFKDSPLSQDIKNIEFLLKEKSELGEKRRLAMIFTDNPQMLWQVGKYPLGNGSCQHYAEGSYADNLMGYVGDANCKVSYLVDLNKLPQNFKQELYEKEFEEIKDKIPAQDLLNACVARSLIKMTKDKKNQPVILLEPTYSKVYKSDTAMDKYFNLFVDLTVAEPMKAKMARGGGNESVAKGPSRSPRGQYEDLNLSSVKFIHKLSKPTKEDEEMIERIRSSN